MKEYLGTFSLNQTTLNQGTGGGGGLSLSQVFEEEKPVVESVGESCHS